MGRALTGASRHHLQRDQPELDARYVYVGVHADGPTRVLCFSETRDQYTRGTKEDNVAELTKRLKHLEERIKVGRVRLRALSLPLSTITQTTTIIRIMCMIFLEVNKK